MEYKIDLKSKRTTTLGQTNGYIRLPEDQCWHVKAWDVYATTEQYVGVESVGGNIFAFGRSRPCWNGAAVQWYGDAGITDVWIFPNQRFYSSGLQWYMQVDVYSCQPAKI